MRNINDKRMIINELLNLYNQRDFVKEDSAGRSSIEAIIKGKEDSFIKLVEEERNG